MRTSIFLILLAVSALASGRAAAEIVDRVVAVVGSDIITLSDVKKFSAQRSANPRLAEGMAGAPAASKDPLEALIREKLLKLEMERLGVAATDGEIDAAVNDVVTRNGITLDILKSELSRKGTPFEKYKKDLGDQIRQMKFLSQVIFPRIKISEDDVARKAGAKPSDEARIRARMELLQARSSEELVKYLDEARSKTFVEIKQ
ncbi:MAG TPA: SurA N-terminal domain-containing protein [bacterium]|nr:SurA N-terminal domain-containing protein [bacterium]